MCISNLNIIFREEKFDKFRKFEGKEIVSDLQILNLKKSSEYTDCYKAKINKINYENLQSCYIYLYIPKGKFSFNYGDYISIKGEVKKTNSARNYMGFDYRKSLKKDNICGCILVSDYKFISNKKSLFSYIYTFRKNIKSNINKLYDEKEARFN